MFFSPSCDEQLRGRHFGDKLCGSQMSPRHLSPTVFLHQSLACGILSHDCQMAAVPPCIVPTFQAKRRGKEGGQKACVSCLLMKKKTLPSRFPVISQWPVKWPMATSSCVKARGIEICSWALEVLLVTQAKSGATLPVRISALLLSGYVTIGDSFSFSSSIKWR